MTFKCALWTGAAIMLAAMTVSSASAADDTYVCNGQLCYDDQADDTRALNEQALQQAQDENDQDDDGMMPPAYSDAYGDDDDDVGARYSHGDDDADANPYDDDADDDDD